MPGRAAAVLAAVALLAACGGAGDGDEPRIVVERCPAEPGLWQATYHLGRPASTLRFVRPARFYRENVWKVVTPAWGWSRSDSGDQLLVRDDGGADSTLEVRFPVYTQNIPKEYELFGQFTDGSVALYTGHLYVAVDPPADVDEAQPAGFLDRVVLVPGEGESVVVQGEVHRRRTTWKDPHGDGTYAYFGGIAPLETASMVGIVDPGAPAWLVERLDRMLPEFFERYTAGFGEALPWKPVVLFSFAEGDDPGTSSGGGTLTGLIQMSATGRGWRDATPDSSESLLYLIAHEAVHLWNGQLHGYRDSADSWMHEGSADAFADLMLLESGAIDAERLAERRTEALNRCARGLRDGPLSSSGDRNAFHDYYDCGNLIAVWSAAATSTPGDRRPLFAVWRTLFERSAEGDGRYDRDAYLATLEALGARPEATARLRDLLDARLDDPAQTLVELFRGVGIGLSTAGRPTKGMRRELARAALQHLMARACDGRYSFNAEGSRLRTFAIDGCPAFAEPLRVVSIAGHSVGEDGDRALGALVAGCRPGRDVTLGLEEGTTRRVACSDAPPAAPAALSFPVFSDP